MEKTETMTGVIKKIIFQSSDFAIFRLNETLALGNLVGIKKGDKLEVTGKWVEHPKYGKQLKIEHWEKPIPNDREGAIMFLSSGLIKGIGPVFAKRIVDALGPDAIKKILDDPELLTKIKGVRKPKKIYQQIQETYQLQIIVSGLMKLGLTCNMAIRAHKELGGLVIEKVKINPYCLTSVKLIDFIRADDIAQKAGIALDSPFRIQAGIHHALNNALKEGHTFLPKEELLERAAALLEVPKNKIRNELRETENLVQSEESIALTWAWRYEESIAEDTERLQDVYPSPKVKDRTLTIAQAQAVKDALRTGVSILTGGPGVGKTYTIKAIIKTFKQSKRRAKILLCAPTGRAARRLTEITGQEAQTIHRLIGIKNGEAENNRSNPLDCKLLIVDEASMLDISVGKKLLEAIPDGCIVLLVGDVDQLPSVGPGNILKDLLDKIPTTRLTEIFRQAEKSKIVTNAHKINKGQKIETDNVDTDFFFIKREEPDAIAKCIAYCVKRLNADPMEVQVLSPMRKGLAGTNALNKLIQVQTGKGIEHRGNTFRIGDKVIQTKNNYEKGVMNGDLGLIEQIDEEGISVRYNGETVEYLREDMGEIELGWAITIHKSQGSEFKNVIVPITTSHYIMLYRNLLYTAVTRAKEKMVLVGTKKAAAIAIRNNKPVQRHTKLREFLAETSTLQEDLSMPEKIFGAKAV
ncbi:ATP-dependent RecD-like DNA helicase [candidate division NPL-UPA2 bacterium]|nr:ATP-dependent RecD-like DNA helicase [candidate division NPL-UPA2 bacterium]